MVDYPHNAVLFSLIKNALIGATLCICHATLSYQFSIHEAVRLVHLLLHIPSLLVPYQKNCHCAQATCGNVDIPPPRILKLGVIWR